MTFSALPLVCRETMPDEVYNLAAQSHVKVSFDMPQCKCCCSNQYMYFLFETRVCSRSRDQPAQTDVPAVLCAPLLCRHCRGVGRGKCIYHFNVCLSHTRLILSRLTNTGMCILHNWQYGHGILPAVSAWQGKYQPPHGRCRGCSTSWKLFAQPAWHTRPGSTKLRPLSCEWHAW